MSAPGHAANAGSRWAAIGYDPRSPASLVLWGHAVIGVALWASNGRDSVIALLAILVSLAAWWAALRLLMAGRDPGFASGERAAWVVGLLLTTIAFFLPPAKYLESSVWAFVAMNAAALLLQATYAFDVLGRREVPAPLSTARRAGLFLLPLIIGVWVMKASPDPKIDLFPLHQQAAQVMLSGRSIYEPGLIATPETYQWKGVVDIYTYLPFAACCTTVAYALTHDCRGAYLVAQLAGGALVWLIARRCAPPSVVPARQRVWADLLAALLLFHPRGPFVLEEAWIEPLAIPFLGGFVLLALRGRPLAASACLGFVVAIKQHLVIYVPFLAMVPGVGVVGAVVAGAVALATIAPFAITNPSGFYRGVFAHHLGNPFRPDSLSIPAVIGKTGLILPSWIGFVAAVVPARWLGRFPRRHAPLLLASCLSFGLFYVFGRQAFCNYYYLLDATALFAAAALGE